MFVGMMTYQLPHSHYYERMSDKSNLRKEMLISALSLRVLPTMARKNGSKSGFSWGSKDVRHMSHMFTVRNQRVTGVSAYQACLFLFPSLI